MCNTMYTDIILLDLEKTQHKYTLLKIIEIHLRYERVVFQWCESTGASARYKIIQKAVYTAKKPHKN